MCSSSPCLPPRTVPRPSREATLRHYRPPACAACPDRAPPRYAAHEQRPLAEALEAYVEERSYACRLVLPQRSGLDTPDVFETYAADIPSITIGPDDVAYVAFTSGSPQSSRKVCWADTDRCRISSPGKPRPSGSAPPTVLACCQDCPITPYSAISSRPYGWAAAWLSLVGNSSAGKDTPDLAH
jgi:hypothetical protein